MNSTATIKLLFLIVLFIFIERKDASRLCYKCESTPDQFDEKCLKQNLPYVKPCPGNFCSIKVVHPVGSLDPKNFTLIRQCAQHFHAHRCQTNGNLRTCTKICSSNGCNYDIPLSPPSDSITTTTTSPSVVSTTPSRAPRPTSDVRRNSCYNCVSVNGNNSNCEFLEDTSSIETKLCPSEKPFCSLEIYLFRGLPGRMPVRTIKRTCSEARDRIILQHGCFAKERIFGFCRYPCAGDFCNNSPANLFYLH